MHRYWCDENPRIFDSVPEEVNVWADTLFNHIVDRIFIDENLIGELSVNLLQ